MKNGGHINIALTIPSVTLRLVHPRLESHNGNCLHVLHWHL